MNRKNCKLQEKLPGVDLEIDPFSSKPLKALCFPVNPEKAPFYIMKIRPVWNVRLRPVKNKFLLAPYWLKIVEFSILINTNICWRLIAHMDCNICWLEHMSVDSNDVEWQLLVVHI